LGRKEISVVEEALEGIKVADFSWVAAGPLTTLYLAAHGATVIRVESMSHPDATRTSSPFKDNILLVGDAGWCQEAEMTGAVMCGWRAAHAVTLALTEGKADREGVQGYIDWWNINRTQLDRQILG
jgi:hypothetical protein